MKKTDLLRFAQRDWAALAAAKAAHWANRKKSHGPADAVQAAESLRKQAGFLRPGWPTPTERAEDLATHTQVTACLARVVSVGPD